MKIRPFSEGKRQSTDANPNMTQMLELSDEDFKAPNEEKLNTPEMNGKFSTEKHKSYKRIKWNFKMRTYYPKEKEFTREIQIIEIYLQKNIRDDRKRMSINLRIDKRN